VPTDRKLTLADIADLRAYERTREEFRDHIIALKKRRRIHVGPHITLMFENRETILFQIQEMARAEKILSDEGIETEIATYNVLIPGPGQLCATLFIELTTDEQLREWLPKLVGIERSVVLRFSDSSEVRCIPDEEHEAQLTREEITASVHYVRFELTSAQVDAFAAGGVTLVIDHPAYPHETVLSDANHTEFLEDLRP
jgi:hypothetical protein